jgi:CHASE2 domain-containing sensor protein
MKGTRLLRSNRNLKVLLLALVALAATAIGVVLYSTDVLKSLEGDTVDTRFSIRGTQTPPKNFVVVAVDNKTLQDLNSFPARRLRPADQQHRGRAPQGDRLRHRTGRQDDDRRDVQDPGHLLPMR